VSCQRKSEHFAADRQEYYVLVDEIHLQQIFYYEGGSVVETGSNSKDATKSAFCFMISSIVCKCKMQYMSCPLAK